MSGGHVHFTLFFNFRTSKDLEILRQSSYMSHILKGLSKRNTHIPHIVLYDEDKWQTNVFLCLFWGFYGWRTFLESDPPIESHIDLVRAGLDTLIWILPPYSQ